MSCFKFQIVNGSVLDQTDRVDVIVNAANKLLKRGEGVCGAIFQAAGEQLDIECDRYVTVRGKALDSGTVAVTSACQIPVKEIYHAVGPNFWEEPGNLSALQDAYYECLRLLRRDGHATIAFPLISSGIFAGDLSNPVATSTRAFLWAYQRFCRTYPNTRGCAYLCCFAEQEYVEATDAIKKYK